MKHHIPLFKNTLACAAVLSLLSATSARAAIETWDGGHSTSNYWFANINWLDNTAPVDNDDLVFTGTARLNHFSWADLGGADNDFDISSITFDNAAGAFVISNGGGPAGSVIKLHGDITNDDADLQTLNFNFQLNNNIVVRNNSGDVSIGGVISQDGSNRKITQVGGSGTLTLSGANTYAGGTSIGSLGEVIDGGTVIITNSSALGTGTVTFEQGGTLDFGASGLNVANALFVPNWSDNINTLRLDEAGSATGTLSGNVQIHDGTSQGFQVDVGTADTLTMSGKFFRTNGGGAGITKIGDGTLVLTGRSALPPAGDSAIGAVRVNGGTLQFNAAGAAFNEGILPSSSIIINSGATLDVAQDWNLIHSRPITIDGGTLNFSSGDDGGGIIGSNYANTITLNNGASITGSTASDALRVGFLSDATITVGGTSASTISSNLMLVENAGARELTLNVADVTSSTATDLTISGDISDFPTLTGADLIKTGAGTLELTGTNTYAGPTTINGGTLSLATGYTHTGTGLYEVKDGGTLKIADGVNISTHAMTISLGGVISPGNSPGTAIVGNQTWGDGGSYLWEINDMAGDQGADPGPSGWDWLDIQGTLDISATFKIQITSLDLANNSGLADGFDYTGLSYLDPYASFTIATATGAITGFDPSAFDLDDSAFLNPKVGWSIENIGGDIILNAFFVPEPSSSALLGLGALALMLRRRRS